MPLSYSSFSAQKSFTFSSNLCLLIICVEATNIPVGGSFSGSIQQLGWQYFSVDISLWPSGVYVNVNVSNGPPNFFMYLSHISLYNFLGDET